MSTPVTVTLDHLAQADPGRPALTCEGTTLTRRELADRTETLGRLLVQRGVRPGDRVAIVLPNGIAFVTATIATWKAGATPVPISPKLPAAELGPVLDLADPALVIGGAEVPGERPRFDPVSESLETVRTEGAATSHPVADPWKILPSGGSTGRPKLIAAAQPAVTEQLGLFGLAGQMGQDGVALITAPLTHNGPFMSMASALVFGCQIVLLRRFDAATALDQITEHQVDWVYAVPTMMRRILDLPEATRKAADLSTLKAIFHMGAPCAPSLKQAWIDWLGPEKIWELYGGTEAQAATLINGTEWLAHRGSVGRAITGEIEVRDADSRRLPPDELGEVWMRASGAPTYRYVGATARTADDGWESLGDLGRLDADGYLYLTDRDTDMILVGGSNVYPAEIEAALEEHPKVLSAAVIGLPHPDLGNVPHAIVQTTGDVTDPELAAHLAHRLAPYKLPKTFERVAHPLRDDAGKLRRSVLRKERLTHS
jgi:bile acid-coenzyme A ligase